MTAGGNRFVVIEDEEQKEKYSKYGEVEMQKTKMFSLCMKHWQRLRDTDNKEIFHDINVLAPLFMLYLIELTDTERGRRWKIETVIN